MKADPTRVRGTHDYLGLDMQHFRCVSHTAHTCLRSFGYQEIQTPILEHATLFLHGLGESSDIVRKEMFTLAPRGDDDSPTVILRPEGTAPIMRALHMSGRHQTLPQKLMYQGPMFRYDRPQKGRLRQFHQVGVEWIGASDPSADVEVIASAYQFLQMLGIQDLTLELNTLGCAASRTAFKDALVAYLSPQAQQLSPDSQVRLSQNPLRILDSKNPADQALCQQAPRLSDLLTPQAHTRFQHVCSGLDALSIPYQLSDTLVRGLDYYSHTVFEFTTPHLGAQATVLAGGRYDGLATLMGYKTDIPSIGWAAGIERLMMLLPEQPEDTPPVMLIAQEETCVPSLIQLGAHCVPDTFPPFLLTDGSLGSKMKKADKMGAEWVLILGEAEQAAHTVLIKNLKTGAQDTRPQTDLVSWTPLVSSSKEHA